MHLDIQAKYIIGVHNDSMIGTTCIKQIIDITTKQKIERQLCLLYHIGEHEELGCNPMHNKIVLAGSPQQYAAYHIVGAAAV